MGLLSSLKNMFSGFSMGGGDFYNKVFQLREGETILSSVNGSFVPVTTTAQEFAAGVASVMNGGLVEIVGENFMAVVTSHGRMVIGMIGGRQDHAIPFDKGGAQFVDTGIRGKEKMMATGGAYEASKLLRCLPRGGAEFQLLVPDSGAALLLGWNG